MGSLSVCVIARDEETRIRACLESVRPFADEVIVVDTGSVDRTPEIAREAGARVLSFEWTDSFSRARNESLAAARCDWILWLDADDQVPRDQADGFRALKTAPTDRAFGLALVNVAPGRFDEKWFQVRMFPRDDRIRFERRVHEQVAPSIQRCGLPILFVDVQVVHTGYADPDARMRKARRNLRLLEMDVAERPDDIHEVSALADAACAVGDTRRGVSLYRRAFDLLPLEDPARAQIAVSLAGCHRLLGEPTDAEAWIARALDLEPAKIDALFLGAQLSVDAGDTRRAMALLEQTIRAEPQATSTAAPDTTPIRGLALVLLARLHVRSDDPAAAEPLYRRAVEDFPMILDARLELAELLFRGPRNKEAAALFDSVVRMHPRPPRALIARANDVRKRARRFGGPAPEHV